MRQSSRIGPAAAAWFAVLAFGLQCTPAATINYAREKPAYVKPEKNSLGQIDFNKFDRDLAPYRHGRPHHNDRTCKNDPKCVVRVAIEEVGQSYDIDPVNGPGQFRVIGLFTNEGPQTEAMYDLLPGVTYYVWVDVAKSQSSVVASRTLWGFIRRGSSQIDTVGYVMRCHPSGSYNKSSYLNFSYCPTSPTKDQRLATTASAEHRGFASFLSRVVTDEEFPADGEGWFECDPGCCTGTRVQQ